MVLTSTITLYDERWPIRFQVARAQIAGAFGDELLAIHHVGSTAVPGLAAKPEIDLLVVVSAQRDEVRRDEALRDLGYVRGSDLSAGHHFHRRDVDGVRTHKIHVCTEGHAQIDRMLRFRDLLRKDSLLHQRYQDLKLALEAENTGGIGEYLAGKAPFIDSVMAPCAERS
ncbi:GrpB family protein [Pseudomonas paraeruginosa]|uniref:GrpB family protein n=1 Tax=Pseudomonas paraeruginosa TaxID=2994495 RepID=UPI0039FD238D|nr:GrpB family protein [Pseudomonas aeruginosa]HCF2413669.1 GrpB family protein [Pseudomonas aeruginosa]